MRMMISAVLLALLLCSCVTSTERCDPPFPDQMSESGKPVAANIEAMISGVYLFYYLPIWSGKWTSPNRRDYEMFTDYVKPRFIYRMFDMLSQRRKWAGVEDVNIYERSSGWIGLGIFWKRSIHASAVAIEGEKKR